MEITQEYLGREVAIEELFTDTFSDSEGRDEGKLIGALVKRVLADTQHKDIYVFTGQEEEKIVAAVLFTRMTYAEDDRAVFLLSPMAVATSRQREGLGQHIINSALRTLRDDNVDLVITYGDISFYSKVGFQPISEDTAAAPLKLSFPQGWIAQSLSSDTIAPLKGSASCVASFNDQAIW